MEALSDRDAVDEAILAALTEAANELETAIGDGEPTMVVKAVVCFAYITGDGEVEWGYRRVRAPWFDVGGAAQMLQAATTAAWID